MCMAANSWQYGVVKALVGAGANINNPCYDGRSPLVWAGGDQRMMHLMLSLGADINQRSRHGTTALSNAVQSNSLATVEFLLAEGAEVSGICTVGSGFDDLTPLEWAEEHGYDDIAAVLKRALTR